jgi:surface antigen
MCDYTLKKSPRISYIIKTDENVNGPVCILYSAEWDKKIQIDEAS